MAKPEIFTPTVCQILDEFYASAGEQPDWDAIRLGLYDQHESLYGVIMGLLQAFWGIYEADRL